MSSYILWLMSTIISNASTGRARQILLQRYTEKNNENAGPKGDVRKYVISRPQPIVPRTGSASSGSPARNRLFWVDSGS